MRPDRTDRLLFLRTFLAHPRRMGAVLPTSGRAVGDMLDMLEPGQIEQARLVVELGAGTGSHTGPVLDRMGAGGELLAFEIDPGLAGALRARLADPRLRVVEDSAEDIETVLGDRRPDVVVSALPFTSLPKGVGQAILDRTTRVLPPGGTLLVLQYSPLLAPQLHRRFTSVRRRVCLRNLPPAFLYACREPRSGGADSPATAP